MLFTRFLEHSLQTGLLILAVLLVTWLLRRTSKLYSYILWILVFFRLLVPVSFSTPLGILPDVSLEKASVNGGTGQEKKELAGSDASPENGTGEWKGEIGEETKWESGDENAMPGVAAIDSQTVGSDPGKEGADAQEAIAGKREEKSDKEKKSADTLEVNAIEKEEKSGETSPQNGTGDSTVSLLKKWILPETLFLRVLWGIWLAGVAIMLCYGAWGVVRLRRSLRSAIPCEKFGVQNVYQSDRIGVPIVSGILRPGIYLPEQNMEPYQMQYILEHEQMHIRRKDWLMKIFSYGLLCVYWFNPLVWLAFMQLERSMEYSCDEAVVRRLGDGEKKAYSRTLLTVATGRVQRGKEGVLTLGFMEKNTKSRIKNILEFKNHRRWITVAVSMVLIGCFMCFLGGGGNFQPGNGWTNQKDSSVAEEQKKTDGQKETDGTDGGQVASKTLRVQDEKDRHGLPVIVVDKDGNIIGTHGGKELRSVVLDYFNNLDESGIYDPSKRGMGYRIEDGAFSACINMKTLIFWNNDEGDVSYVAENAFEGCPSDLVVYCKKDTYLWRRLKELHVTCIEIPEEYDKSVMLNGKKRTEEIEEKMFQSYTKKEKEQMIKDYGGLVVSDVALQTLSREEMQEYEGSPYFVMVEGGRLIWLGGSLRDEVAHLGVNVEYPSEARNLGDVFMHAYGMAQTKIPEYIEEIGGAFADTGLRKLEFETRNGRSQLKTIGVGAFSACNLSDSPRLVIPEGVTELGAGAFHNCDGLKEIVLPKSIKKIGGDCFSGCNSLLKVTIKSPDVVFDEESSITTNGIFSMCGMEYIEEKNDFIESKMVLYGPKGSTTQKYAKERGIRFKSID